MPSYPNEIQAESARRYPSPQTQTDEIYSWTVTMWSEEYGAETFNYPSAHEAKEGLLRLLVNTAEQADAVERWYKIKADEA